MLQRLVFNEKISIIANIAPGKDADAVILKLNMVKLKDNVVLHYYCSVAAAGNSLYISLHLHFKE